jgi:hypothetical protein
LRTRLTRATHKPSHRPPISLQLTPALPPALPVLGPGVPAEYQYRSATGPLYELAEVLIAQGIASPEQWAASNANPLEFVQATFSEWSRTHMQPTPHRSAEPWFYAQIGHFEGQHAAPERRKHVDPHALYITAEPRHWYHITLGATLAELEREAGAEVAATFYQLLVDAACKVFKVIEPGWVDEYIKDSREFYEDMGEGEIEMEPVRWPPFLKAARALPPNQAPILLERVRDPILSQAFERVLRLDALADRASSDSIDDTPYRDAYDDGPLFSLTLSFTAHDAVHAHADEWGQHAYEVARPPSNIYRFEPRNPTTVRSAFDRYGAFCEAIAIFAWLSEALPDGHPLE